MNRLVDDYIEALPDAKREIAEALRELIFTCVPHVQEKLSFKIPFYHYFGMLCFMNEVKEGVDLVFCRGKDLVFAWPQLQQKGRVIMAGVTITALKEISTYNVEGLLIGAAAWNEEAKHLHISPLSRPKTKKKKAASKKKRL
ncbi:MAG: DUF1801 domain-containing protein [Chitinophagaceae bacterium]|nr:DUF1801 domain-containing protein [Chitinophagaceae bacterium]